MKATAGAEENALVTTDLIVEYHTATGGTITALDQTAITVEAGTSLSVMGPSGCGKSTLLGLLAGLALPTRGSVTIGATELSALGERDRVRFRRDHLGMVYQADNLLPYLTVEENIALPLSISASGDRHATEVTRLLDRLGLKQLATRFPDHLSGRQRQRVAVARAVVHLPKLILADEPTGALDKTNARSVVELLIEIQQAIGATLVMVTHDPAVAAHATRTLHMGQPTSTKALTDVG